MANYDKLVFSKFRESCQLLLSGKITERKVYFYQWISQILYKFIFKNKYFNVQNQVPKITEFLSDKTLLKVLDENTKYNQGIKNGSQITRFDWNDTFLAIKEFMIAELKQIQDKTTSSSASKTTAENKVYAVRALLNLLLNQINSSNFTKLM